MPEIIEGGFMICQSCLFGGDTDDCVRSGQGLLCPECGHGVVNESHCQVIVE